MLYLLLRPDAGNNGLFDFVKFPGADKVVHFTLFFGWTFLHFPEAVYPKQWPSPTKAKLVWVLVMSVILAIVIELAQNFIPGRQTDIYDLVANASGSTAAIVAVKIVRTQKSDLI